MAELSPESRGLAVFVAFASVCLLTFELSRPPVPGGPSARLFGEFLPRARAVRDFFSAASQAPVEVPARAPVVLTPPEPPGWHLPGMRKKERPDDASLGSASQGEGPPPARSGASASMGGAPSWQLSSEGGSSAPTAGGGPASAASAKRGAAAGPGGAGPAASARSGAAASSGPSGFSPSRAASRPGAAGGGGAPAAFAGASKEMAGLAAAQGASKAAGFGGGSGATASSLSAMNEGGGGGGGGLGGDSGAPGLAAAPSDMAKPKGSAGPPGGGGGGGGGGAGGGGGGGGGGAAGGAAAGAKPGLPSMAAQGSFGPKGGGGGGGSDDADSGSSDDGVPQLTNAQPAGPAFVDPNGSPTVIMSVVKTPDGKEKAVKWTSNLTVGSWNAGGTGLDPQKIPFISVPKDFSASHPGVALGDYAAVSYNGHTVYAIVGDVGPAKMVGQGSVALASRLGVNPDPNLAGVNGETTYVILPGSRGQALPRSAAEVRAMGKAMFQKAGIPVR